MDFFEAQEQALRLSRRLIGLFGAAVLAMIGTVYLTIIALFGFLSESGFAPGLPGGGWWHAELFGGVAAGMGVLIGAGSAFRTAQLRKGGGSVARLLGGRPVASDTTDPAELRLRNVVEEMSIASGIPVPEVYILDRESGINAFAAGNSIHDAAVAVTRGTLDTLDRDELQGVIAHEFSHILNGDMRLNLRLIGLLFGILLLTVVGRGILRGAGGGRRSGRQGGQIAIIGLVLVLLGYLGVFFGRMIQAAISRQREFLADAAAVQFTRNPAGISGALKKIGNAYGSRISNSHADEVGHLFFASGVRGFLSRILATHPPLDERIRRLDPQWDGVGLVGAALPSPPSGHDAAALASGLLGSVGAPNAGQLRQARTLLSEIPPGVREAAHTPAGAECLVLALLLSSTGGDRASQLDRIRAALGNETAEGSLALGTATRVLRPDLRLPLLDLALPSLRGLPPDRREALQQAASGLIRSDGRITPFEFALFHVLRRNLEGAEGATRTGQGYRGESLGRMHIEVGIILSALAHTGSVEDDAVLRAFEAGASRLSPPPPGGWRMAPQGALGLAAVDGALDRLQRAAPTGIRRLLEAAIATVRADGRLDVPEVELLRAVAEALDAPIPPVVVGPV